MSYFATEKSGFEESRDREFLRLHAEIKTRYFCGGGLRTQSYFVEKIANGSEEAIRKYVQNQSKVMDKGEKSSSQRGLF